MLRRHDSRPMVGAAMAMLFAGLAGTAGEAMLLGGWPLRGGQEERLLDRGDGRRHAAIRGDVRWAEAKPAGALYFGGGLVEIPSDDALKRDVAFTFEAWVALETKGRTAPVVGKGGQAYAKQHVQLFLGDHGTRWQFSVSDGKRPLVVSAGDAAVGTWVYLAGTWDRSTGTVRIYRNGREAAHRTGEVGTFSTDTPLRIGGETNSIAGLIGDVRVHGRALAAAEIAASFARSRELPRPDPAQVFAAMNKGKLAFTTDGEIACGGTYPGHLQGLDIDKEHIFWSFTTTLVKTDRKGNVLKAVPVPYHHGGIAVAEGKLYAAHMPSQTVKVYKTDDLSFLREYPVPEVRGFPGGIECHKGEFYIAEGTRDRSFPEVYRYSAEFRHLHTYTIPLPLNIGIQTIGRANGLWWLGAYDSAHPTVQLDDDFGVVATRRDLPTAYGVKQWAEDTIVTGVSLGEKGAYRGKAILRRQVRE